MAFDHALVLGGGIAGLFTAGVLARHCEKVTLVESDRFPAEVATRTGVPQGVHVHGLLTRGLEVSEELMPGITAELVAGGAVRVDMGVNAIRNHLGWSSRFVSGLEVLGMSRSLFEWTVRRRLMADGRIEFLDGHRAVGLIGSSSRVTGATLRSMDTGSTTLVSASLVVDATGRGSQAPRWLSDLGCAPVREDVVDAHIGYATRLYAIPDGHAEDWRVAYVQLGGPHQTRGGLLTPIEGNRWQVTLTGVGADAPSTGADDFLPFARTLSSPIIADALAGAEPLTGVTGSHATSNRRRYFERAGDQPDGFAAIGDAVCAFNPIYGQGMTVGALGAVLLGECIEAGTLADNHLARWFYPRLARLNDSIWNMTTAADSRFPGTEGRRSGRTDKLVAGLFDRLIHAANNDHRVQDAFLRVFALQRGPSTLLTPSVLTRVLRSGKPVAASVGALPPAVQGSRA
ncbi:hypothetical protein Lesp02_16660 [Lentzea sp. NBRC 105346]|uniref:NAD(P)/FAD-dependent oxidoreductase n=1 Tax=Lentzea sp. NBRC 105346 TaxID=3032205 RepID=UPI00249FFB43|nr:FAD-dependent oxidoreductase [Lentzea sp. NBRC 105346]GLZ29476.1 hypothetical protein Lesp02_16660 [Lentzea sp. NBRC 105346]